MLDVNEESIGNPDSPYVQYYEKFNSLAISVDPYGGAMVFCEFMLSPDDDGTPTRTIRSARRRSVATYYELKTVPKISNGKIVGNPALAQIKGQM